MSKETSRMGKWKKRSTFMFYELDEDGVLNTFEVDQDKITPPTLLLDLFQTHPTMVTGIIKRIHYRLNPTNAVTFTLRLWRATKANPYELNLAMLYESPAAQVDDTDYDRNGDEIDIPFSLETPGQLYFSIDWSGAPGNTTGFISVEGEKID
jgi:hypothetical protein